MSVSSASIVGSHRALSFRRDPVNTKKVIGFVSQIILTDYLSQVHGNVVNPDRGADIMPDAVHISNAGNSGANLLTCDLNIIGNPTTLALGGTDGNPILPGSSVFIFMVTDDVGDGSAPPTKTGLVATTNSSAPQNGFALTHGSLIYTNYLRSSGGLYNICRTNNYTGFIDGDQPLLFTGIGTNVFIPYQIPGGVSSILPNAGDPSYLIIKGTGSGRIKIWGSLGNASLPEFDASVNGSTGLVPFTLAGSGGFYITSTDSGAQIYLGGIGV